MTALNDFRGNDDFAKGMRGLIGEADFDENWLCACGARLVKNDVRTPWEKDRRCPLCQTLVDVKTSTGGDAVAISRIPFDNYPPDMILALYDNGVWRGILRRDCLVKSGPHPPAHRGKRPTWYYWVYKHNWDPLEFFLRKRLSIGGCRR